jgi:hypothetical protein
MALARSEGRTRVRDGASRTRTGDLLGAIQALSQLSYSPARGHSLAAVQAGAAGARFDSSWPDLIVSAMFFDSSR